MVYVHMSYGFDGCPVQFGPLHENVNEADMVAAATSQNGGGFCFNPELAYGKVMVGMYPAGCQSPSGLSWWLYLKSASLPQFMEHQTQTNWCWAANGASVGNYYWGSGTYTQCGIANACQQKTTCCTSPSGCNQYGFLDLALQHANSFDGMANGTAPWGTVMQRIDASQPVGTRVAWNGGGAHFMMIAGYNNNGNKITLQDPWYGTSTIAWSAYPGGYQVGGTWTTTYYTKKQ